MLTNTEKSLVFAPSRETLMILDSNMEDENRHSAMDCHWKMISLARSREEESWMHQLKCGRLPEIRASLSLPAVVAGLGDVSWLRSEISSRSMLCRMR
jgi:hypothetical protein